ncbi:MAG: hypothetical protein ABI867_27190 [Kofleriaceae bacterium]
MVTTLGLGAVVVGGALTYVGFNTECEGLDVGCGGVRGLVQVGGLTAVGLGLMMVVVAVASPELREPVTAAPESLPPHSGPALPAAKRGPALPAAQLAIADPQQRQLAIQASSAARHGNCTAARASSKHLESTLLTRLREADPAFASCFPVVLSAPPRPADPIALQRERDQRRTLAFALLQQAREAATAGNCASVMDHSKRVHELDLEFHATVFVRDHSVARCLTDQRTRTAPASPK